MNYGLIFFTGLTSGALSCAALQGGLLASAIAAHKHTHASESVATSSVKLHREDWLPTLMFLGSKLVTHTLLGFFLGWLGVYVELSLGVRLFIQTLAAVFILATAGSLLELHPAFRFLQVQTPRFLQRYIRRMSRDDSWFTPAVLGASTIFIPCGVTQAMEVLAVTSGSPWTGAAILFLFVLGTSPLFALIGVATSKLSETFQQTFRRVAAFFLVLLAVSSLNGVLTALDFPFTWQKATAPVVYFFSEQRIRDNLQQQTFQFDANGVQKVLIEARSNGYSPRLIRVKAGQPVELTVQTNNTYSCASSFLFPAFNLSFQLGPNDQKVAQFTPTVPGKYQFSCSMGMYTGTLEVI